MINKKVVLLALSLSPSAAFAYDADIISMLIGIPICIISFFICLIFSIVAKSNGKFETLLLLSSPCWLFVLQFLTIAMDPDYGPFSSFLLTTSVLIVILSAIPILIFRVRAFNKEASKSVESNK
ncbi:MAG: hypothetical protein HWE27_11085 [Gammaproteobacteria bacterium]|nr:hypothetical protein [Gammaproteobacteria bacterium]